MSAVAARKAAAARTHAVKPSEHSLAGSNLGQEQFDEQGCPSDSSDGNLTSSSSSPASDKDLAPPSSKKPKNGRKPTRPTRSSKGKDRYFGPADEDEIAESEMLNGGGQYNKEEARASDPISRVFRTENGNRSTKLGRGKRQRREKSSFLDMECISTFQPIRNMNVFDVFWNEEEELCSGQVLCLKEGENFIVHGSLSLSILYGGISVVGSELRRLEERGRTIDLRQPPENLISHSVFAPASHPLPVFEACGTSSNQNLNEDLQMILPNGSPLSINHQTTVVLLKDLDQGIESIEDVMKNGGIGCANGMWPPPNLNPKGFDVGGQSWRLICQPTSSLVSVRTPKSWRTCLDELVPSIETESIPKEFANHTSNMRIILEGPARIGKSTLSRFALNRLLSRYKRVAFLDTDLGQSEFTVPGLVSLNVLDREIIGPSFTHLSIPFASHFLGHTSPASDPLAYLDAVLSLIRLYESEIEYDMIKEDNVHADPDTSTQSRILDYVPLVINTQGWVKGLGRDLLSSLKEFSKPSHILSFNVNEEDYSASEAEHGMIPTFQSDLESSVQLFKVESAVSTPLDSKWSAADLRTLSLISYFYTVYDQAQPLTTNGKINILPLGWDFSTALVSRAPYSVNWGNRKALSAVSILHHQVAYEQVLHVLNGSLVALVLDMECTSSTDIDSLPGGFPYSVNSTSPKPASSRCLGMSIVRSIDIEAREIYLLTPLNLSNGSDPLTLIMGSIDFPKSLALDHLASDEIASMGVAGLEWKLVPYLTIEAGDASGRKRIRRNLMRRNQT